MRHPAAVRVSTISSAPAEFTCRPRDSPVDVLVDEAQATSPRADTRIGPRTVFIDIAYLISP